MSVKTFECQIVRAQIGRYLAGEMLSKEAQLQMEAHINGCSVCSEDLAERRSTLQALLTKPVATPTPSTGSPSRAAKPSLIDLIRSKTGTPASALVDLPDAAEPSMMGSQRVETALEPTKPVSWKPLAYSGALALVLLLMSTIAKDPTKVFGPRANAGNGIAATAFQEPSPSVAPATLSDMVPAPFTALIEGYEANASNNRLTLENSKSLIGMRANAPRVAAVSRPVIQRTPARQPISANQPTRATPRRVARRNRPTRPTNSVRIVPNPQPATTGGGITVYNP